MVNRTSTIHTLLISIMLLGLAPAAHSRELYRYYNAEGNVVVDYRVPAEYIAGGYEVLNNKGTVIRVVPRELTEGERDVMDAQQKLDELAAAEEERLRKWDESLLLRYSTIADIEAARERALRDFRIRVSILKSNRRSLKQQVENYQIQAADLERSGQQVDMTQLSVIEDLQGEIGATDRAIVDREREIEEVAAAYQRDIERFGLLLDVVELRRVHLAQDPAAAKRQSGDPR
ncbi:MAG: hypothetical protein DRR04_08365 [Gammaproteobacteria bacterium]|nr:MAG: hypothetical protein DRQ97_01855 [Gammaproteobacteria bacterium]RLA59477.1 MAG: hypothetical protein DRR04_08365 [Gammaproteobacteria bacterium]